MQGAAAGSGRLGMRSSRVRSAKVLIQVGTTTPEPTEGKLPWEAPMCTCHGGRVMPSGAGYAGAAGPSRVTARTWSTDSASHGNSTSHHVAPAPAYGAGSSPGGRATTTS